MESNVKNIVNISKNLYNKKLVSGKAGNISIRYKLNNKEIIAITPTSKSLVELKVEDIVLIDINGNSLNKGKPSSELFLHLNIYKKRSDINGIVHTHSPYATGFSFSNKHLKRLEGFGKINSEFIKEVEYEFPGSKELANNVAESIENEDVLILKNHGIIATGKNLKEAASLAEFVEETAKIQFISNILNKI